MIVQGLKAAGSHRRASVRAQAGTEIYYSAIFSVLYAILLEQTSMHLKTSWCSLQALWFQPSKSSCVRAGKAQLGKNSGSLQSKLVRQSTHALCPRA